MATRTTADWLAAFAQADIPAAPMYDLDDILKDEHVQAIDFIREVEHPTEGTLRMTSIPTEWSVSVPEHRHHAPLPGENTRDVLMAHGFTEHEVDDLSASGVVRTL